MANMLLGVLILGKRYVIHCYNSLLLRYSGKIWQGKSLANLLILSIWRRKVWQMNRFTKFAKLSSHQTLPLYGMHWYTLCIVLQLLK